jgi:5'-methylthioadenosine phosphorylase
VARAARSAGARPLPCVDGCDRALDHALITAEGARDPELLRRLDVVAGRVLRPR